MSECPSQIWAEPIAETRHGMPGDEERQWSRTVCTGQVHGAFLARPNHIRHVDQPVGQTANATMPGCHRGTEHNRQRSRLHVFLVISRHVGITAHGDIPAVILQLLLVATDLVFHLVQGRVENDCNFFTLGTRDEIVSVLGVDENFHFDVVVLEIRGYFDLCDSVECCRQSFSFCADVVRCLVFNFAMSARELDLHGWSLDQTS